MNSSTNLKPSRRTISNDIFDQLHRDIMEMRLVPGSKVSESGVASQYGVSRQPVREAFIQLCNMGLLEVRPQKATIVQKISIQEVLNTRFVRTAVEVEVIRKACESATKDHFRQFRLNLKAQERAASKLDITTFHALDYDFHHLVCISANAEFAFSTIAEGKSHSDRLCMICLTNKESMQELIEDHRHIFEALQQRDAQAMIDLTRSHLQRLDETLHVAVEEHSEYFKD